MKNKITKLILLGSLLFVSGCNASIEIDPTERLVFPTTYKEVGTMRLGELEAMPLTSNEYKELLNKIYKATEETYIGYEYIRDEYETYDPYDYSYNYFYHDEYTVDQYTNGHALHQKYRSYFVKDGNFYGTSDNYDYDSSTIYVEDKAITYSKNINDIEYWTLLDYTDDHFENQFNTFLYYNYVYYDGGYYTFSRGDYKYLVLEKTDIQSETREDIYGNYFSCKAKRSRLFVLELDKDYRMLNTYYETVSLVDHDYVFGVALNEWVFDSTYLLLNKLHHGERKAFDKFDTIKGNLPESYITKRYHQGFYRDVYYNESGEMTNYGDKTTFIANSFYNTRDNDTEYRSYTFARQDSVNRAFRFELTRTYTNFKDPTKENLPILDDLTADVAELFDFPLITIENEQYFVVPLGSTENFTFRVLYSRFGVALPIFEIPESSISTVIA